MRKKHEGFKDPLFKEIHKVIVGQDEVIEQILICLISKGHALLVGVPGLAKTLLISTIAEILDLSFKRIQFTPDLMPSDITGTDILEETPDGKRFFRFVKGPVFANLILADEINRSPPKTQSALLEAMQEHKVTVGGKTYKLEEPFFVLATQNPIEQEGTYPLPEAQLDRFMFFIDVRYPSLKEEIEIVKKTTSGPFPKLKKILSKKELLELQKQTLKVPVADYVVEEAVKLVRASRPDDSTSDEFVKKYVQWGAGPRASQFLILGAKARALLYGKDAALPEDVRAVAYPVLKHRIILNFTAEADGINVEQVISHLLKKSKL